jgi:hypothetical protein
MAFSLHTHNVQRIILFTIADNTRDQEDDNAKRMRCLFHENGPKQIANKAAGRSLDAGKPGARGQATFTGQGEAGRPVSTRRLRRASKDRDVLPHRKSRVTMPVPGA